MILVLAVFAAEEALFVGLWRSIVTQSDGRTKKGG
jgi:hypothetical protein